MESLMKEVIAELKGFRQEVNHRFDGVDKRFEGMDKRFDKVVTTLKE